MAGEPCQDAKNFDSSVVKIANAIDNIKNGDIKSDGKQQMPYKHELQHLVNEWLNLFSHYQDKYV